MVCTVCPCSCGKLFEPCCTPAAALLDHGKGGQMQLLLQGCPFTQEDRSKSGKHSWEGKRTA